MQKYRRVSVGKSLRTLGTCHLLSLHEPDTPLETTSTLCLETKNRYCMLLLTGGRGRVSPEPGSCGPGTKINLAEDAKSGNLRISLQRASNLPAACAMLSAAVKAMTQANQGGAVCTNGDTHGTHE